MEGKSKNIFSLLFFFLSWSEKGKRKAKHQNAIKQLVTKGRKKCVDTNRLSKEFVCFFQSKQISVCGNWMDTIKEKINKSKNFHVVISGYSIKFRSKSISKIKKMSANVTNRFFFFFCRHIWRWSFFLFLFGPPWIKTACKHTPSKREHHNILDRHSFWDPIFSHSSLHHNHPSTDAVFDTWINLSPHEDGAYPVRKKTQPAPVLNCDSLQSVAISKKEKKF